MFPAIQLAVGLSHRRCAAQRLDSPGVSETAPLAAAATTDAINRPCAHCGRPVPQRAAAGRPFRYCRDNDDACLRAARAVRMRQRNTPGLAGQVAQAFEIADGWLPIFWSPEKARDAFGPVVANARPGFDIAATAPVILIDDVEAGREFLKPYYALYIGGMGARGKNFYNELATRYGYEAEAREIQDLYLAGNKRDAAAAVPDAFIDDVALVGPKERIAERIDVWRDSGATSLLVSTQQPEALRAVAEILL